MVKGPMYIVYYTQAHARREREIPIHLFICICLLAGRERYRTIFTLFIFLLLLLLYIFLGFLIFFSAHFTVIRFSDSSVALSLLAYVDACVLCVRAPRILVFI